MIILQDNGPKFGGNYTLLYPESGNTFDSLGEAYLNSGNRSLATTHYLKSLQLDPANENAAKVLQEMLVDNDEG